MPCCSGLWVLHPGAGCRPGRWRGDGPAHVRGDSPVLRERRDGGGGGRGPAYDAREILPEIPVPVLLVCGDRDVYFPKEVYEGTARLIPDCTLRMYAGIGHIRAASDKRLAQDVLDFVRQRPAVQPERVPAADGHRPASRHLRAAGGPVDRRRWRGLTVEELERRARRTRLASSAAGTSALTSTRVAVRTRSRRPECLRWRSARSGRPGGRPGRAVAPCCAGNCR